MVVEFQRFFLQIVSSVRRGITVFIDLRKSVLEIPEEIKTKRSNELLLLDQKMSEEYRKAHIHKQASVLFEEEKEINGKVYQIGHSMEYIKVVTENADNLSGKILTGSYKEFLEPGMLSFVTDNQSLRDRDC